MKRLWTLGVAVALLSVTPAAANLCTIDATPAATLLLPYFEVDIDNTNGIDTFFSINNSSDESVMTHVVVWTDLSVEALDFNVYLTGYDVQTIGMGLIIRNGILPVTGDANQYSNVGAFSDPHPGSQNAIDYPGCLAIDFPYAVPQLDEEFLEGHLQPLLTGGPSDVVYSGRCGGVDHGDNIARGYVTVDVTNDCTLLRPCDVGYFRPEIPFGDLFNPEQQVGAYWNVLWGDWYMVDYANNYAQGDNLVHIEAIQPSDVLTIEQSSSDGDYNYIVAILGDGHDLPVDAVLNTSFYTRCQTEFEGPQSQRANGRGAAGTGYVGFPDLREPLATTYATRFYQNAAFAGGTDLLVWRDSNMNVFFGEENGFDCGDGPSWYLNERQVVVFDEEENPQIPDACPVSPCPDPEEFTLFPYETQRFSVPDATFITSESGWLFLNLNQTRSGYLTLVGYGTYTECEDCIVSTQAWVQSVHSADGRFSVGLSAIQLDSQCFILSTELGADTDEIDYPITYDYYYNYGPYSKVVTPYYQSWYYY